jgi:cell division protein FtsB
MRRWRLILVLVLLLLSLLANAGLLWTYGHTWPEVQRLQQEVDRQSQELGQVRQERDSLVQQVQALAQDKQRLEDENTRLQQELNASQGQGDILEQLDRLEAEARAVRRQVPPETVPRVFISRDELRPYLEKLFAEEYTEQQAATDAQVLEMLGLLEPGTDLYQVLLDLYTEQTLGFYDLRDGKLYVVGGSDLGPLERVSFVHEYVHALQDQVFDLGAQTDAVADDSDRARALEALAEGDASLAMGQYMLAHPEVVSAVASLSATAEFDMARLNAAPPIVREELLFPYQAGLSFVLPLYAERGWAGVDAAWADPPQSTEQILHPDRYPDDTPALVGLPPLTGTLGAGWRLQGENTLGEFMLRQHLALYLDSEQVDKAATGWGGDHYALYVNSNRRAACLVVRLLWDDLDEAKEFADIYQTYADQRYGVAGEGEVEEGRWWNGQPGMYLQRAGDEVWLIMAPSLEEAQDVARELR